MNWKYVADPLCVEPFDLGGEEMGPPDKRGVSDKAQEARRRVLLRTGAQMHSDMSETAVESQLAMLDSTGVVVSWYDFADADDVATNLVLGRHLSQFYIAADIDNSRPQRALRAAVVDGRSVQRGWRRRPSGATYWGTTVIEAVLRRDGSVRGFSHETRRGEAVPA